MTNNNIHNKNNILNNTINSKIKIKLSFQGGKVINVTPPEVNPCETSSLDFSCSENSQYIPTV